MESEAFNWNGLPLEFKIEVASLLNQKEKLALQLCSKNEHYIGSLCPIHLQSLTIGTLNLDYTPTSYTFRSSISSNYERFALHKTLDLERSAEYFVRHFKHRNSFIHELIFKSGFDINKFMHHSLSKIRKAKKERGYKTKIRVKEVEWRGSYRTESFGFTEFLTYLDTSVLETIKIECYQMSRDALWRLMETEQFKKAQKVSISPYVRVPIERMLHLHTVELQMNQVEPEDAVMMIKNFQTKPLPDNNYFTLTSYRPILPEYREIVFDLLELPNTEDARRSLSCDEVNHVLSFSCHNPDSHFLLKIDNQSVFGVIASKEFVKNLKMDVSVFMNLREFGFDWQSC